MKKIKYIKIIFKLNLIKFISSKNAMFLETLLIFLLIIGSVLFNVNDDYITDILIIFFLHLLTWKFVIENFFNKKHHVFLKIFIEKLKYRKNYYKKRESK